MIASENPIAQSSGQLAACAERIGPDKVPSADSTASHETRDAAPVVAAFFAFFFIRRLSISTSSENTMAE